MRIISPLILTLLSISVAQGQPITKCQDEDGNWHYGDFASEACAEESTVTEMDERGQTVGKRQAPPSREELAAEEAAAIAEQQEAERQVREQEANQRLLRTYDSLEGIIQARDARLESVDQDLESHRLFRQDLVDERKRLLDGGGDPERIRLIEQEIEAYDDAIRALRENRQATMEEYNADVERYREITGD